jgi:flagellar biosynthetic protein FliO
MRKEHSFSRLTSAVFLVALLIFILCAVGFGQTTNSAPSENLIRRAESSVPTTSAAKPHAGLDVARVGISLAVVVALIYATRWTLKKIAPAAASSNSSSAIRVISRNPVSPKQQIVVVQVGRRLLVVGDSGQQLTTLCEISDPDESATLLAQIRREKDQPVARSFAAMLGLASAKFKAADGFDEPAAASGVTQSASLDEVDLGLATTREELDELMDKVRDMQRTMKRG